MTAAPGASHYDYDLYDSSIAIPEGQADGVRRYVAGQAHDAVDARQLLEALGLIDYQETSGAS